MMSLVHYLSTVLVVLCISPVFAGPEIENELKQFPVGLETGVETIDEVENTKDCKHLLIKHVVLPFSVLGLLGLVTTIAFAPAILADLTEMPKNVEPTLCRRICAHHNEFYIPQGNSLIKGYCNQTVDVSSVVNVSLAEIGIVYLGKGFVSTAFNNTPLCHEAYKLLTTDVMTEIANELGNTTDDMPSLVPINQGE